MGMFPAGSAWFSALCAGDLCSGGNDAIDKRDPRCEPASESRARDLARDLERARARLLVGPDTSLNTPRSLRRGEEVREDGLDDSAR